MSMRGLFSAVLVGDVLAASDARCDTIYGVMWGQWRLSRRSRSGLTSWTRTAMRQHCHRLQRLEERGNLLRFPSRALGDGLFELRLDLDRVAWRITYFYAADRRIVLLTVFRKQRLNERAEVQRARWAMTRCITEQHTAEEDDRRPAPASTRSRRASSLP